MQQPVFFENEIVLPSNLNFLNTSTAKNIKDVVVALNGAQPGIVSGLTLQGVSGNNFFTVTSGYGYTGDGERIQVYSTGLNFGIAFTGNSPVYLTYTSAVYNPDPTINPQGSANVVTNTDPTNNSQVAVENYNLAVVTTASGSNYIRLGVVSADANRHFLNANASGSQDFVIGGVINLTNQTISGYNIASGSIDSNIFSNPLHYSFALNTGVGITVNGSGDSAIGSVSHPLASIAAMTGLFHQLVGFSPILIDTMQQVTGTSLESTGTNLVQIDQSLNGVRLGGALTIRGNNISTVGLNKSISINTDPTQVLNINTTTNLKDAFVSNDLTISGATTFAGSTNISNITGNLVVNGAISYGTTNQQYVNLAPNSDFSINAQGQNSFNGLGPSYWSFTANNIYAYGPVTNANWWLSAGTGTVAALNTLTPTGNYTVEANVKILGASYNGNRNYIWQTFLPVPPSSSFSTSVFVTSSGNIGFQTSTNTNTPDLMSATGIITNNQWYDVAVTWDGSNRKIYVNNTVVANDSNNGGILGVGPTFNTMVGAGYNGLVSNLRVSNVARTSFPSGSTAPSGLNNSVLAWYPLNNSPADISFLNTPLLTYGFPGSVTYTNTGLGQAFTSSIMPSTGDTLPIGSQNALFGPPHTSTWLLGSGININQAGVQMYAPVALKPNTTYNVSYFAKGISGSSPLSITTQFSGTTTSGTSAISSVSPATTVSLPSWQQVSNNITTPDSGTNFNIQFNISNTLPTGVLTPTIGLAGVQITEGTAQLTYSNPRYNINQILISPVATFTATNGNFGQSSDSGTIPAFNQVINTKGGFCNINASLAHAFTMINHTASTDIDYRFYLYIDGVQVGAAFQIIPYGIANQIPTNYTYSNNANITYGGFLSPGSHHVEIRYTFTGSGPAANQQGRISVFGGNVSNLNIMIFE